MKLSPAVFKCGEDIRVLENGGSLRGSQGGGEAVENFVVDVEDGGGISELGGIPVVMGWKYGGLI